MSGFRFAIRALLRNPLFTAIAVVSLGLGIGANTAIFTIVDQLLIRNLPVRDPGSLVMLYQEGLHLGFNQGQRMHSYEMYQDIQQKAASLSEVICRRMVTSSLAAGQLAERVTVELVSGNYFSMLGVGAAAGRVLQSEEDDRVFGGHPVVVLSHSFWSARFNRDRSVVGRKVLVNNHPMTIVGVAEESFAGLDPASAPSLWAPILMMAEIHPDWPLLRQHGRRARWLQIFARLKPGYTIESARAPVEGVFRQVRAYEATLPAARAWTEASRRRFLEGTMHLDYAGRGYSQTRQDYSFGLLCTTGMVGLLLLIACANVASLLIARAYARQKEIAVRLSLGGTRGNLIRQLLAESLVLAGLGTLAGLAVSVAATRALLAFVTPAGGSTAISPYPDLRILAFTLGVTVMTALLCGLAPAIQATRPDLWSTLKDPAGAAPGTGKSVWLRKGLVAGQVGFCFLLLFGAGLFVRSLQNLRRGETGFREIEDIVTFQVAPGLNGYDNNGSMRLYRELRDRLGALPGVRSIGQASVPLLHGFEWDNAVTVEGHTPREGEEVRVHVNAVSPRFFETLGVRVTEGRVFEDREFVSSSSEPASVVVNRAFADQYFPGRAATGRRIGLGSNPGTPLNLAIVGVVADSLYEGPRQGIRRMVYFPTATRRGAAFYLRAGLPPATMFGMVRKAVAEIDPSLPVFDLKTLAGQLDETLSTERLVASLAAGLGLLATALASVGLYGVMAFVAARRTREIGIRMALGAQPSGVMWLVMKEVLVLVCAGAAAGLPAALALGRLVSAQLYGVPFHDGWSAAVTIGVITSASLAAGLAPAWRASRTDPIVALRQE